MSSEETVAGEGIDPRIRRTRLALQSALGRLLESREFDRISVQDVAEAAGVNRATFYDHYADKFALLECMVGTRFHELLEARGVRFDSGCSEAFKAIVLGVCDYLAAQPRACERQLQMEPHVEAAVIAVVRRMLLDGLEKHPPAGGVAPAMLAATLSWAIYGAAKEWVKTPGRCSSDAAAKEVMHLVEPMFALMHPAPETAPAASV